MVNINYVMLSGNVGSVNIGLTGVGTPAFSMLLAIDQKNSETLWVRVNVFGPLARKCGENINKGDYVIVVGELMDRKTVQNAELLEVRAKEVIFGNRLTPKEVSTLVTDVKETVSKIDLEK